MRCANPSTPRTSVPRVTSQCRLTASEPEIERWPLPASVALFVVLTAAGWGLIIGAAWLALWAMRWLA